MASTDLTFLSNEESEWLDRQIQMLMASSEDTALPLTTGPTMTGLGSPPTPSKENTLFSSWDERSAHLELPTYKDTEILNHQTDSMPSNNSLAQKPASKKREGQKKKTRSTAPKKIPRHLFKGHRLADQENVPTCSQPSLRSKMEKAFTEIEDTHSTTFVRYYRGLINLRNVFKPIASRDHTTDVYILVGPRRTGKSKTAREWCHKNKRSMYYKNRST